MQAYPHLRQPIEIGGMVLRNRVMMTTHGPRLSQQRYLSYLEERERGGAALFGFNAGALGVSTFASGPGQSHLAFAGENDGIPAHPLPASGNDCCDTIVPAMRALAECIHRHGAYCKGQSYHSGAGRHQDIFQPAVNSSSRADEPVGQLPHALTTAEISKPVEAFALCAARVPSAGCDGIELHAAHGYLLHARLSARSNRRTDTYCGSFENRTPFPLKAVSAGRHAAGGDYCTGLHIAGPMPG